MYRNVSITIIMASAILAILIVPWAALQRSHAQSDLADTILKIHNDERAAHSIPPLKWSDACTPCRYPARYGDAVPS
jgi:uncharacterized protein YkwD